MRLFYFVRRSFPAVILTITLTLSLSIYWSYNSPFHTQRRTKAKSQSYYDTDYNVVTSIPTEKVIGEYQPTSQKFIESAELFEVSTSGKGKAPASVTQVRRGNNRAWQCPQADKILLRPDGRCYMLLAATHIPAIQSAPLSLPCFVLPAQKQRLTHVLSDIISTGMAFLVQNISCPVWQGQSHAYVWKADHLKRYISQKVVVQTLPTNADSESDVLTIVNLFVLLTSLSPIRVYRHDIVSTWSVANNQEKVNKKNSSLQQLIKSLSSRQSHTSSHQITERIDHLIVNTLFLTEASQSVHLSNHSCFSFLRFSIVFNSTLYPFLTKVTVATDDDTPASVMNDTLHVLSGRESRKSGNRQLPQHFRRFFGVEGPECSNSRQMCLRQAEVDFLLESEREQTNARGFTKLYPIRDGLSYEPLVMSLQSVYHVNDKGGGRRGTLQLHKVLALLEKHRQSGMDSPNGAEQLDRKGYLEGEDSSYIQQKELQEIATHDPDCDNDPEASPVMTGLYTDPQAELQPSFRHDVETYQITLPFDVMYIRIWGVTSTCSSHARVNNMASLKSANHPLGVGRNTMSVHLVDTSHGKSWVLMSYKLYVYRRYRHELGKPFVKDLPHVACSLVQECDMKIFPSETCGLQDTGRTWKEFVTKQSKLTPCTTGHVQGRWAVPCSRCENTETCHWYNATWAPLTCQHTRLSRDQAKSCLANKKVLFVGDSTNRGIMYYLMEKINGSLRHWEKTHTMKVYSGALNEERTSVSFAYYPQFWLPSERKPEFVKALFHLIARFLPLANNTNTILVVGGVHWMLPSHVTAIRDALNRLGLSGIRVIIKTLGSGFHLPMVTGFTTLDLAGQLRIAHRNAMVTEAARSSGFELVDTYNITIARYKEFLYGNCGCHFHKVVNFKPDNDMGETGTTKDSPYYHVRGPINALYSELVIGRMCI